jgi:hypothetical protein
LLQVVVVDRMVVKLAVLTMEVAQAEILFNWLVAVPVEDLAVQVIMVHNSVAMVIHLVTVGTVALQTVTVQAAAAVAGVAD